MAGGAAIFILVVATGLVAHRAALRWLGLNEPEAQLCSLSAALVAGLAGLAVA